MPLYWCPSVFLRSPLCELSYRFTVLNITIININLFLFDWHLRILLYFCCDRYIYCYHWLSLLLYLLALFLCLSPMVELFTLICSSDISDKAVMITSFPLVMTLDSFSLSFSLTVKLFFFSLHCMTFIRLCTTHLNYVCVCIPSLSLTVVCRHISLSRSLSRWLDRWLWMVVFPSSYQNRCW